VIAKLGVCTFSMTMAVVMLSGCGGSSSDTSTLRVDGSDTMVNLAQAWAEDYSTTNPKTKVQVLGGGSGVGIASLINGTCDMANASRKMKDKEIERVKAKYEVEPKVFIVGFDALAVYVHKDNPLDEITLEELAEIYGDGGSIEDWSKLGDGSSDLGEIIRVSRQNNSGTYAYFQEAVLGKERPYKDGSLDQSGSKDVVALVARTKGAIGYSGMGYATDEVKMLKVIKTKDAEAVAPSVENAQSGAYPITRPLHIYTVGEPAGAVKTYIDWILGPNGQAVVEKIGYVPVAVEAEAGPAADGESDE